MQPPSTDTTSPNPVPATADPLQQAYDAAMQHLREVSDRYAHDFSPKADQEVEKAIHQAERAFSRLILRQE